MSNIVSFNQLSKGDYQLFSLQRMEQTEVVSLYKERSSTLFERIIDIALWIIFILPSFLSGSAKSRIDDLKTDISEGRMHLVHVDQTTLPGDFTLNCVKDYRSKKNPSGAVTVELEKAGVKVFLDFTKELAKKNIQSLLGTLTKFKVNNQHVRDRLGINPVPVVAARGSGVVCSLRSAPMQKAKPKHIDEVRYQSLSTVLAADGWNQAKARYPNGCTHFSVKFLENRGELSSTALKTLIDEGCRGLVRDARGLNGEPLDVLGMSPLLEVDLELAKLLDPDFGEMSGGAVSVAKQEEVSGRVVSEGRQLDDMRGRIEQKLREIVQRRGDVRFMISTGIETFAVRARGENIEFFDPHGNAAQTEPSVIFVFSKRDAAAKITNIIFDRAREIFANGYGVMTIYPVKFKTV